MTISAAENLRVSNSNSNSDKARIYTWQSNDQAGTSIGGTSLGMAMQHYGGANTVVQMGMGYIVNHPPAVIGYKVETHTANTKGQIFFATRDDTADIAPTERLRIHPSGIVSVSEGIELGSGLDSTAANVLSDYEEGTFTPNLIDTSNNAITSYTTRVGEYTKIGDIVHYFIQIEINAKGSALGGNFMKITGLPFNPTGNTGQYPASTAHSGIDTGSNGFFASVYSSQPFLYLFEGSANDTTDQLEPADMADGDNMILIGTYKTAS